MSTGELTMKITNKMLKNLINEVLDEAVLKEATFNTALEKINQEMKPFFILSASRYERGSKFSRGNLSASKDLEAFLKSKGLSWTMVDGGYTEFLKQLDAGGEPVLDDKGQPVYQLDDEGNKIPQAVEEISYLVFGDDPHYGDEANRVKSILELFEIAKEACKVDKKNPQDSFSFGYPVHDETAGENDMFIALYKPSAPKPGRKNAFRAWGGPWEGAQHFPDSAEGAYTGIRKGRATFAEEKLKEALRRKVKSVNDGRRKQADIKKYQAMVNKERGK